MKAVELSSLHVEALRDALSAPRLEDFLREFEGEDALPKAIDLYNWNARLATECFTAIGHLEVLLRNTLDKNLSEYFHETERGIPWFLQHEIGLTEQARNDITRARERLSQRRRSDSRHRIVAELTLGFWCSLLKPRYEGTLWTRSLSRCFKNPLTGKTPDRSEVAKLADRIRQTRNRVAHHNYLRAFDVPNAMSAVFELAELLSQPYADWMRQNSRWREIYDERPKVDIDTVVVAAGIEAWSMYERLSIYACQEGRFFRDCEHIAFYEKQHIHRQVPAIIKRFDGVAFTDENSTRLEASEDPLERRLGQVIRETLTHGLPTWSITRGERRQVFLLTQIREKQEGNDGHIVLTNDIPHRHRGRGSAFTQRQRYVSSLRLRTATTTDEL